MRRLNPRESKLVAVAILVALFAVAWLGIVKPVIGGFFDRAEQRRVLLDTYKRNQRLLAGVPVWSAQAQEQRRSAARFAILATTQAQATDTLKDRVAHMASDTGAIVKAVQDTQPDVVSDTVRVRADLQITLSQLSEGLKRLETEEPYVVVEFVSIGADRALGTGRLSPLDVRLEVSAPWRASGARRP